MIKYRKNMDWGSISFSFNPKVTDLTEMMRNELENIQNEKPDKDIDVVDVIIRTLPAHYNSFNVINYVTIFYAIEDKKYS